MAQVRRKNNNNRVLEVDDSGVGVFRREGDSRPSRVVKGVYKELVVDMARTVSVPR